MSESSEVIVDPQYESPSKFDSEMLRYSQLIERTSVALAQLMTSLGETVEPVNLTEPLDPIKGVQNKIIRDLKQRNNDFQVIVEFLEQFNTNKIF